MRRKIVLMFLCFILTTSGLQVFALSSDEAVNVSVYEKINPSIVFIEAFSGSEVSTGTGIVINKEGAILTGSHVVDDNSKIEVTTSTGKVYPAIVLYRPKDKTDLAIIGIKAKENLPAIKLGDSSTVKVGQKVLAVGNPFGFKGTLTTGIISRIDYVRNKIQTDAAINPGSSGGPVVNTEGEVIGISQSIYNPDNNRSNIGIGFAIPVNEAKKVLNAYEKIKM